ncbi:MAG: carboxypeptidase regulatory-like domain-containing protein [Gemmatimonadaceae bacterium]
MAQVLRGTVMDTTFAGPVDGARVAAFSTAGVRIADAVTRTNGEFTFHLPAGGNYRLHASRLGYATTITEPIRVDSGSEASVVIPMVRLPLPLDTVTVLARPLPATQQQVPHLVDAGFYRRERMGFGYFLTRADIDKRAAPEFKDLLTGIPGVRVYCSGSACRVTMPGSTTMFIGKSCSPSVVLDGALLSRGGAGASGGGFDALSPFNLEAVEIYSHSTGVPVQWRTSACGAIVAWSRR